MTEHHEATRDWEVFERPRGGSVALEATFATRLQAFVAALPAGAVPSIAAKQLIDSLDESERALFDAWLAEQSTGLVAEYIRTSLRSKKSTSKRAVRRFSEAVEGFTNGDVTALTDFRLEYNVRGEAVPLGELTGHQHLQVAHDLQCIGTNALFLAAIHRQAGRILGNRRTRDLFSEQTYSRLFDSKRTSELSA